MSTPPVPITGPCDCCGDLSEPQQAVLIGNCGCGGTGYSLCAECDEWIRGRITCPFHGD